MPLSYECLQCSVKKMRSKDMHFLVHNEEHYPEVKFHDNQLFSMRVKTGDGGGGGESCIISMFK